MTSPSIIARRSASDIAASNPASIVADADNTLTARPTEETRSEGRANARHETPLRSTRYEILGEHGRGGLGRVLRAFDHELGREVAIKELLERNFRAEARFLREGLITARLEHPAIVPIHEAGRWSDGTPYYAMKLIAGRPLSDLIGDQTSPTARLALLPHVAAVSDAIAYAHSVGIIHRDLKPSNIVVGDFGETIVVDWGVAKDLRADERRGEQDETGDIYRRSAIDEQLTRAGSVIGTPAYMAPEQARGEEVDERADVYALGVITCELCVGRLDAPEKATARLRDAKLDGDLIAIITKAMAPSRSDRYPNAGALADDLRAFVAGARIGARRYSLPSLLAHWIRRHRAIATTIVAATLLVLAGVALYVRDVTIARDRAEAQRIRADAERDRSLVAQASLLLERDPTRAKVLLGTIEARSAQVALLRSRAEQGAAVHVVPLRHRVERIVAAADTADIAIVTRYGELSVLDPWTGVATDVDVELNGPIVRADGRWLYSRSGPSVGGSTLRSSPPLEEVPVERLLSNGTSRLRYARGIAYALERTGDLYQLGADGPRRVEGELRDIVMNDDLVVRCDRSGTLTVRRGGELIATSTCVDNESSARIAAAGQHWATLRDQSTIEIDGRLVSLPTAIAGEYEMALSDDGLLGIADYAGKGWYVRPGAAVAEPAPTHPSPPFSIRVAAGIAAWGHTDGSVTAIDTHSNEDWRFTGHSDAVPYLAIAARGAERRLISASNKELRIWDLAPRATGAGPVPLPCSAFHVVSGARPGASVFDCSDGSVGLWDRDTGTTRVLHRHEDLAYGLVKWRDEFCSAGWDGRVLCSTGSSGDTSKERLAGHGRVRWLASCPDATCLVAAADDWMVWRLDDAARPLFRHDAIPRFGEVSSRGVLASVAYDGTLVAYDLVNDTEIGRVSARGAPISAVAWRGDRIWTGSEDGWIREWEVAPRFRMVSELAVGGFVNRLRLLENGYVAVIDEQVLQIRPSTELDSVRIDLGRRIRDVAVSPEGRWLGVVDADELTVIDLRRGVLATAPLGAGDLACASFAREDVVIACGRSSLRDVEIDRQKFITFDLVIKEGNHEED